MEQQLKEGKQVKVQNWRERLVRWRHVSDDDSKRQCVKNNDFLYVGQRKLTVTVCPWCKAVHRSGVMQCHDTMSSHVMECHEEIVTSEVDSTWNGRCA